MTRILLLASALALATAVHAQTYTAGQVTFSDPGSFTQAQLEEAAGIHAGTRFVAADLSAAAKRLIDTGYFDDVGATLAGKITAITVVFKTRPTPRAGMLPVGFDNFVWLTHDELETAIKAKLPLFNGYLPENSPHQEDIKAALVAALAVKSIPAEVSSDEFQPTLSHPVREIVFTVDKPALKIANIKLSGVTPALAPLIQKSVNATAGTRYTEGPADKTTADRILAPLLDAGYAQATLTNLVPTPTPAGVVLSASLIPGEVFYVASITYPGTPVVSAAVFDSAAKLHPGDLANHALLLKTLEPIDTAYRNQGYLDVAILAAPTYTAGQVAYAVSVTPGEPYHVREVTPTDLPPAALADFNQYFLLKPGSIYNPDYVAHFLKNNTALHSFDSYSAAYKAYADPNTHTVDLVTTFFRGAH